MHTRILAGTVLMTVFAASGASAQGLTLEQLQALDKNDNRVIDPGEEMRALGSFRSLMDERQDDIYTVVSSQEPAEPIPVDSFVQPTAADRAKAECKIHQRFFLRDSISDVSLLAPSVVKVSTNGAAFSVNHNNLTDVTQWSVGGTIAWLPKSFSNRCLERRPGHEGSALEGFALAPFLEFSGSGDSSARGNSNLTFGVKSELRFSGGQTFPIQLLSFNPFFRTDFDGKAEVYGLQTSWAPYAPRLRLHAYPKTTNGTWWWTFSAHADYLSVESTGRSGLTAGNDFAWLGAKIGVNRTFGQPQAGQFFANANWQYFYDAINSQQADFLSVGLGVFIDDQLRNAVVLEYQKGRSIRDLTRVDGVTLTLRVAF